MKRVKEINTIKALEATEGKLDEIAKVVKAAENVSDDLARFLSKNSLGTPMRICDIFFVMLLS